VISQVTHSQRVAPSGMSAAGALDFARRQSRLLQVAFAIALYFAFACYLTWPMVTDPGRIFYGAPGDPFGSMSFYRELVDHHHNPFLPGTISQFAAPEGQAIPWTVDLAALPSVLTTFLLTAVFGPIAANGLYILLGYTLTGVVMFLFMRRLTRNVWVSLLCGWALAFYPFAALNGQGHADYIHAWVLVLAVWRMLELQWHPSRRNAILAGLTVALGMWWTQYFILIGGVAYVALTVAGLVLAWRQSKLRSVVGAQAITAVIVVIFLSFLASLTGETVGNSVGVRTHSLLDVATYSARPLEYVIPDQRSPVFGGDTANYLVTHLHGSNFVESTLYIGDTLLLLAIVAVSAAFRRRLSPRLVGVVGVLGLTALVGFIASLPPELSILGVNVPAPSHFVMKVTTTWRVYSRFVVLVMLAVTALAGVGLDAIVRGRRMPVQVLVMLVAAIVVPLDLWGRLVGRTNTYAAPAVYTELARQPKGLTAEYPLTPQGYNNYGDIFFQNVHGMPMINGYDSGSPQEARAETLANLADPSTAPRLAALGVRYVVLDAVPPLYGLPSPGTPGRGFHLLIRSSYGSVYRVTAHPSGPALATVASGFFDTERTASGAPFNWMSQDQGTIELAGTCRGCRGVLEMNVLSFATPRLVTIRSGDRVLLKRWVSTPTQIRLPLTYRAPGQTLTIATDPGPQSIHEAVPTSGDMRSVSIQVSGLQFVWPVSGHPSVSAHK
jgi:hypothetical protein